MDTLISVISHHTALTISYPHHTPSSLIGTADVGLDLQAALLENAISVLNKEHILSTTETRVALGGMLERFGTKHCGALPSAADLSAVSRWEANLAEQVLEKFSPSSKTEKATKAPTTSTKLAFRKNDALRAYFAAGSYAALEDLLDEWKLKLHQDFSTPLELLIRRFQCRVLCRRLSITEVVLDPKNSHVLFFSQAIDKKKWQGMVTVVPPSLAHRVNFGLLPTTKAGTFLSGTADVSVSDNADSSGGPVSVICLRDIAGLDQQSDDGTVEVTILEFLKPLVQYADDLLDNAVKLCDGDPDNPKKRGKKATATSTSKSSEDSTAADDDET